MMARLQPWIIVLLLLTCIILSFIDRQILSLLITPIKADLRLSDVELGLLNGPAFIFLFALTGIPLGWIADKVARPRLIAAALAFWSIATMACAACFGFGQLWLARSAVGLGEGALGPASHGLMGDSFDARRLPLAMGIYSLGGSIGPGLALLVGGQVLDFATRSAWVAAHGYAPWRVTFVLVGLLGLFVVPLVLLLMRDPRRQSGPVVHTESVMSFLRTHIGFMLPFTAGSALLTGAVVAQLVWLPAMFERSYGLPVTTFSTTIGLQRIVIGSIGTALFAILASRLVVRRQAAGWMVAIIATALINGAACLALGYATTSGRAIVLVGLSLAVGTGFTLANPLLQLIAPPTMRSRLAAIYVATSSLIGWSIGSTSVGAVTDWILRDEHALGRSLGLVLAFLWVAGGLILIAAVRPFQRLLAERAADAESR